MSHDLDAFLLSLYSGASTKISALDAFSSADLGRIYGTPASHLEAAEKLAHDSACFLEQFEGTPLHGKAIALVGEELQIEAERIQRDEARRAQAEPVDDSWSKQRMIDLKKRQLELELHKIKSQHEASETPEQEIAEHAEGVPAPQTSGGVPAKTAALKLAVSQRWIEDRVRGFAEGIRRGNVDERLHRAARKAYMQGRLANELRSAADSAGGNQVQSALGRAARKRDIYASTLRDVPNLGSAEAVIADRSALRSARAAKARALIPPNSFSSFGENIRKTSALKLATDAGLAALLKGRQAESWRNAASYLSPKDLLGKAVESGKAQAGGMSRSVASYAPARARLHQLAAGGNTVAAEALKRGELDLEKAAGLQELLTRLTTTRAQRLAKMDARGAAALAKSRAASPARSAVRGMIDELRGSMPKTTASEVSGVRRLPTSEAARISSRPPLARASIERHAG